MDDVNVSLIGLLLVFVLFVCIALHLYPNVIVLDLFTR